jgi:hypothetical protein
MPYTTLCFYHITLSVAVLEWSTTKFSAAIRYPIVDILSLISLVGMVFNLLSNIRLLHGMDTRPHTNASLRLY